MRTLLALVGLAALVLVALLWTGMISLNAKPGSLPHVSVEGGNAPSVKADVGSVSMGTENKIVSVPTIDVHQAGNAQAPQ